jgi:hypothetical protein
MTLGRLLLAWVPVAIWFAAAGWAAHRVTGITVSPAPTAGALAAAAFEALVVTLFASLWFDSLGHGAWWVLFGLIGLLASALSMRPAFASVAFSVMRYFGAGAILAWRLG